MEDKVTELEAKILALERGRVRRKYKRDRSSERSSPIDDRSLRRLRRKSLDSATTSEPMKLLMRLSTLENQVTNVNASTESLNTEISAKTKVEECLGHLATLKTNFKLPSSPSLLLLEQNLNELSDILDGDSNNVSSAEISVINSTANTVVKQLQNLLIEKLRSLNEKRGVLRDKNELDGQAKLQILAEKIAFENILIRRIQEALASPSTGEVTCERLIKKKFGKPLI